MVMLGGNNFDPYVYNANVHNKMVQEILYYFEKILQVAEQSEAEIFVCGLIPRPRHPHLKFFFEKTSHGGLKTEK